VNGVAATLGGPSARSGTPDTEPNPYRIGNRGDGTRNFDGWISSVAIWNELIPAEKALLISGSYSPLIHLPNLIYYNPLVREAIDIAGGRAQTITGTAVQPHPTVLRERGGGFVQDGFIAKTKTQRMVFEGSSTIEGFGLTDKKSQSFPAQAQRLLGSGWETYNFGVGGTGFTEMVSRSPFTTYWLRDTNKIQDVVFCLTGANDLATGGANLSAADTWTLCQTWTNAMKAKGFKVILSTLFAQNLAGVEAKRAAYNALVIAGWAAIADGLADFASDSIIGNSANWNNTIYYQADTVHLTEKGVKDCLLPYFRSSISSL